MKGSGSDDDGSDGTGIRGSKGLGARRSAFDEHLARQQSHRTCCTCNGNSTIMCARREASHFFLSKAQDLLEFWMCSVVILLLLVGWDELSISARNH